MFIYLSNATAYDIYNRQFMKGKIIGGYQCQKFNHSIIIGLSNYSDVVSIANLPYGNVRENRIDEVHQGVRFLVSKNSKGIMRKPMNVIRVIREVLILLQKQKKKIECIVCDAYSLTPNFASKILARMFKIPIIAIVTDLPDVKTKKVKMMQGFDGYVLLTEAMNELVNPTQKPYMLLEGICAEYLPEIIPIGNKNKIILYSGALWKNNAGIEYLVNGFIKAKLDGYELHLYGTGELVPWICEMGKKHPQIIYKGCLTNAEIVKKQCEASLLVNPRPSDQEFCKYSFPSKMIEYMSSATPVLTTRLPGIPDEYFEYCFVINDETESGIAHSLKKALIDSQTNNLGIKARKFIAENKSCEQQGKRIYNFIVSCCNKKFDI